MLYFLAVAIRPRMLMTVDESGEPLTVTVRVGQVRARHVWDTSILWHALT